MSSIYASHCELCKKLVEEELLSFDHEGFEVCDTCKREGEREASKELDESYSRDKD
jgi:ribosome-binding protein aMBF1 (putative translation factor)